LRKFFGWSAATVLLVVIAGGLIFYRYPLWVNDQFLRVHLWRSHVRSEYVQVGSYRLHYLEAVPADGSEGTPLVLVHGLGARGEDWSELIPRLAAAGFHVYAPDLLGFGRSPRADVSYSIPLQEETVVGFIRAIHLGRADVGGWSMGGWIAMKLTLDHPEMVDRLVLYDSAGVYFPASEDADLFTPTELAGVRRLVAMLYPHPAQMPDFVGQALLRAIAANGWVIQRSMEEMMAGRDLLDFRLQEIDRPTLVIWGSHDDLIPLESGDRIHERIPNSSMAVIEGCGHMAPAECWRPVLQATVEFLRAQPPMEGGRRLFPEERK
jgi:pimeloyl-ACP methyl ester carboxylesterase